MAFRFAEVNRKEAFVAGQQRQKRMRGAADSPDVLQKELNMQNEAIPLLRCPICSGSFHHQGNSLICEKGHCYDIARQGHVNFVPNAKSSFYRKELFESRAAAFEAGVFRPVIDAISDTLRRYVSQECPVIADAGCGEGYYLRSICPGKSMNRIGFDLAKEAILLAAKSDKRATYFVADLGAIPLTDGCCDAVLDVFTPANYAQFGRILKKDGVLIKLAPRAICESFARRRAVSSAIRAMTPRRWKAMRRRI